MAQIGDNAADQVVFHTANKVDKASIGCKFNDLMRSAYCSCKTGAFMYRNLQICS